MLSKTRFPQKGEQPPPPAKGLFFIALLMMPAFLLLIFLLLMIMQYKQLRSFASDAPMPIAAVAKSRDAEEKTVARVHGFFADTAMDTLSITSVDFNHFLRTSQALNDQKFDYHFDLEDSVLVARNSLPVSSLRGLPGLLAKVTGISGYLNSVMKASPRFQDGKITLTPVSAVMNGAPAPATVLESKGVIDVREWVADKEFYDRSLEATSEVKIRDGRLLVIKRR